jgi:hypothetical protein
MTDDIKLEAKAILDHLSNASKSPAILPTSHPVLAFMRYGIGMRVFYILEKQIIWVLGLMGVIRLLRGLGSTFITLVM